jgi:GT2 family glycosyltransferase/SAM-dependent methyltransferase
MSFERRAAAPRLIQWTGERCVPWTPDVQIVYEHFHRYLWAGRLVSGREVLDLGSGEGFGAAILAASAANVVGLDIDERTVEHSRLNYAAPNLQFRVGTALDLAEFDDGSLGVVVAFEVIEHVREQGRMLDEIARVLADDGILIASTPDRRLYSEVTDQRNPFHAHELAFAEFRELLAARFPHLASWGQRAIAGSHMNAIDAPAGASASGDQDFYLERLGEEWRPAAEPAALYLIALASRAPLPEVPATSTLADCGIELMRDKERDAVLAAADRDEAVRLSDQLRATLERERAEHHRALRERDARMQEEIAQRDSDILFRQEDIVALRAELSSCEADIVSREAEIVSRDEELSAARQLNRRVEESVTWQAFQRARGRLYGAIGGERSLLARALGLSLRLAGRRLIARSKSRPAEVDTSPELVAGIAAEEIVGEESTRDAISVPEYENPKVSLVIPLYAHAELTRACLESIRDNTTHVSYEVILVDDDADEETKKLLEDTRGATILHNEENLGYLRSVNRGAEIAKGRWLVIFNNDTEVTRGWLSAMVACAESAEDVGVVTPKFVYPDGTLNEAGGIIWRDGTGANYGRGDAPDLFQYEYRRETDYGSAAALMVDVDLWRSVGGFDERYLPMFYEDTDLCFAARERGLKVLYEPEAVVIHVEGATTGNDIATGYKRYQEQNRPKFAAKWRHRLESEHLRPAPTNVRRAADRHRGLHVLIVDHRIPTWDRDAGSLRMLHIIQALQMLDARVTFMPDNLCPLEPYSRILQKMGVEVIYGAVDVNAEMATIGSHLSLAILSRPHPAGRWLDTIREFAPSATVAYDTVDLHWLREARRGELDTSSALLANRNGRLGNGGPGGLAPKAQALRHLELAMIKATDTTLVVTECERAQVQEDVPGSNVVVVPTIHDVQPYVPPPGERSGVFFVGSFEHHPNADAAVRLVKEVMPAVWREVKDMRVTIVGPSPPPEVQALASPLVDVTGWVEDLQPLLDQSRLMVAPLRFGAGMKGKITQALAAGLPVVTTPIGAEGLDGDGEEFMLLGEDPQELAAHVLRVYRDEELWWTLSRVGQAHIFEHCSREVLHSRLSRLLEGQPVPVAEGGSASSGVRSALLGDR